MTTNKSNIEITIKNVMKHTANAYASYLIDASLASLGLCPNAIK